VKNAVRSLAVVGLVAIAACSGAQAASCSFHFMTPGNVSTEIDPSGGGYVYSYTVGAISTCDLEITSFSLPYLPAADISSITSPTGWTYSVSSVDSFGLGGAAGTLTWTAAEGYGIEETYTGTYLSGFSYESAYGTSTGLRATVSDSLGTFYTGTFALIPSVPEPTGMLLTLLGTGALLTLGGRRQRASAPA
jgi:hypothetical protein